MADRFLDLRRNYEKDVREKQLIPYSKELFPIPEYPEDEASARAPGMWPGALGTVLSTLRCLAPVPAAAVAALLTIFWGQHSLIYKLLKHIDSALRSIIFSSEAQKATVLRWLSDTSPVQVECLDQVWQHGWILCGVVDGAMPGACAGHQRARTSIEHAQRLAEQYLGVEPVFTHKELESSESLNKRQEWKLAHYLDRVRQALAKLSPPVSKLNSPRTADTQAYTLDYVARGIGLYAAQTTKKMYFKIFPTAQQCLEPAEINILIRGPKDTYGTAVIPPIYSRAQLLRQAFLGVQVKSQYTERALPLTQGTGYFRSYGKNDLTKAYYIPKVKHDIEVDVSIRRDYARVSYAAELEGNYEISLISRGYNLIGSPFKVTAIAEDLEYNTSKELDDDDECGIVEVNNDRRVIFRIVDFVSEKMLLNENGILEKISNEEASKLITTSQYEDNPEDSKACLKYQDAIAKEYSAIPKYSNSFKYVANKILTIVQVCDAFRTTINKKKKSKINDENVPNQNNYIPDIVTSMIFDKRISDKEYIDYQTVKTGERAEKKSLITLNQHEITASTNIAIADLSFPKIGNVSDFNNEQVNENFTLQPQNNSSSGEEMVVLPKYLESHNPLHASKNINSCNNSEATIHRFHESHIQSRNGDPFLGNNRQNDIDARISEFESENLGYMQSVNPYEEYNINVNANESMKPSVIEIVIETGSEIADVSNNPFIDNVILERPKTPVLKIITGEITDRDDSVYIDPAYPLLNEVMADEELRKSNEFLNPFFVHKIHQNNNEILPVTDFLIGAPVSLPPLLKSCSPEPDMDSVILAPNLEEALHRYDEKVQNMKQHDYMERCGSSIFATPLLQSPIDGFRKPADLNEIDSFHSIESNNIDSKNFVEQTLDTTYCRKYHVMSYECLNEHVRVPHKDLWDSAYVSIDEPNSSPDSNNNDTLNKYKTSLSSVPMLTTQDEFFNMGPAEREIWQNCADTETSNIEKNTPDSKKPDCSEYKRKTFTPILEENYRSMAIVTRELETQEPGNKEQNSITAALSELNDIYREYCTSSENSPMGLSTEKETLQSFEVNFSVEDNKDVNSASEIISDVMRHHKDAKEELISGVQSNATEPFLASRALEKKHNELHIETQRNDVTVFGENNNGNLVIERKKYWDEKIKLIEEIKSLGEIQEQQNKNKTIGSKQLRHSDLVIDNRDKNIAKNSLKAAESQIADSNIVLKDHKQTEKNTNTVLEVQTEIKLVHKWKKYWDDKLETEETIRSYSPAEKTLKTEKLMSSSNKHLRIPSKEYNCANYIVLPQEIPIQHEMHSPIKQDITDEKLFKAFETSPKRFFGTSRKNILEKIDSFLKYQNNTDTAVTNLSAVRSHGNGIVSSRVSMFNKSDENINKSYDSLNNSQKRASICDMYLNKITYTTNKDKENKFDYKSKDAEVLQPKLIRTKQDQEINANATKEIYPTLKNQLNLQRKLSTSKSEMDIFNKTQIKSSDDNFNYRKSCEDLPKVNVRNVITLFESVTKIEPNKKNKICDTIDTNFTSADTYEFAKVVSRNLVNPDSATGTLDSFTSNKSKKKTGDVNNEEIDPICIIDENKAVTGENIETTKNRQDLNKFKNSETGDPKNENSTSTAKTPKDIEYKERFKMAKKFFQSFEELASDDTEKPLNECEIILYSQSPESRKNIKTKRKKAIKAHSVPTSDCEYETGSIDEQWNRYGMGVEGRRLIKISEKFHVEDLFNDVAGEGKLSREGSFRGIPNKQAVLAAFKSMENISDTQLTSYEISESQLSDFAKKNKIKTVQTYLTEYPYLPQTEPSKYRSRVDSKASGLISRKELLYNSRRRRNSVPDALRLNERFTTTL